MICAIAGHAGVHTRAGGGLRWGMRNTGTVLYARGQGSDTRLRPPCLPACLPAPRLAPRPQVHITLVANPSHLEARPSPSQKKKEERRNTQNKRALVFDSHALSIGHTRLL